MSTGTSPEESGQGAWRVFTQDLAGALRVWRTAPLLPLSSIILMVVDRAVYSVRAPGPVGSGQVPERGPLFGGGFVLLVSVIMSGWVGTERVWYLRAYRGKVIHLGELWRLTRAFIFRYMVLGLLVFGPTFVAFAVAILWLVRPAWVGPQPLPSVSTLQTMAILMFLLTIPIDVFLTFVTPALAYTTPSVRKALGIGWRMLRNEWPESAGYALVPPLALLLGIQTLPESLLGRTGELVLSGGGVLLNLWFKGATAAFYFRRYDPGDNGAAFAPSVV